MSLVLWFLLSTSFHTFCLSTLITLDTDGSIYEELKEACSTGEAIEQFSYDRKLEICTGIVTSTYIQDLGWTYVEKSGIRDLFLTQYPQYFSDHYDQNNINECFVVKEHDTMFPNNEHYALSSFACLAQDSTAAEYPFREIFVSYAKITDTFLLSVRGNRNPGDEETMLEYFGIAEISPSIVRNYDVESREEAFRNDFEEPNFRLNGISLGRRSRICKLVLNTLDNSLKPDMVESSILSNATVQLNSGQLVIGTVLHCSIFCRNRYFHRYLAVSRMNQSAVYVLRLFRGTDLLDLTELYFKDLPTLNNSYRSDVH